MTQLNWPSSHRLWLVHGDALNCVVAAAMLLLAGCSGSPTSPDRPAMAGPSAGGVEHIVSGVVSDSSGVPVQGATIKSSGGPEAVSDAGGEFRLRAGISHTAFHVTRAGFEPRDFRINTTVKDVAVRVIIQPVILVADFTPTVLRLLPDDLPYYVGEAYESDYCRPCKIVRLKTGGHSKLSIDLRWTGAKRLVLWTVGGALKLEAGEGKDALHAIIGTGGSEELAIYIGLPLFTGKPQSLDAAISVELITTPH